MRRNYLYQELDGWLNRFRCKVLASAFEHVSQHPSFSIRGRSAWNGNHVLRSQNIGRGTGLPGTARLDACKPGRSFDTRKIERMVGRIGFNTNPNTNPNTSSNRIRPFSDVGLKQPGSRNDCLRTGFGLINRADLYER